MLEQDRSGASLVVQDKVHPPAPDISIFVFIPEDMDCVLSFLTIRARTELFPGEGQSGGQAN